MEGARLQSNSVVTAVRHLVSLCCALPLQASACASAHHTIVGVGSLHYAGMLRPETHKSHRHMKRQCKQHELYLLTELCHPNLDSHLCISLEQAGMLLNGKAHLRPSANCLECAFPAKKMGLYAALFRLCTTDMLLPCYASICDIQQFYLFGQC